MFREHGFFGGLTIWGSKMADLLVYEKKPNHAAMLARLASLQLKEVRSIQQLEMSLRDDSPAVVVVEVSLDRMPLVLPPIRFAKTHARAAVIAIPSTAVKPWATYLHEAGADLVFWSVLDRPKVIALIRNRMRLVNENHELEPIRQRIWGRLPWKRHASGGGG